MENLSFSIDEVSNIKLLIQIFSFFISKEVNNLFLAKENNHLIYQKRDNQINIFKLSIDTNFFKTCNLSNNQIISIPILSIINDLKLCKKNKKNFPIICLISRLKTFDIQSIYNNEINTIITIPNLIDSSNEDTFVTKSQYEHIKDNFSFEIKIDIISKLLGSNMLTENFVMIIEKNVTLKFEQTNSIIKSLTINHFIENNIDKKRKSLSIIVSTSFIKDIIKYFNNDKIKIAILVEDKKIISDVIFKETDLISLKLINDFDYFEEEKQSKR